MHKRNQPTHDADVDTETDDEYGFKSRKYPLNMKI